MDVKSYHMPYVHKRSIKTELKKGDLLLCQVVSVNEIKDMTIDIQAKLDDGILLNVSAKKVPRVIGKHRSMITLLEKFSGSKILVGANGNLFVQGGKPNIVKNALDIISKYSHVDNLTDKMNIYLQKIKWVIYMEKNEEWYFDAKGKRFDGRTQFEHRPINLKVGVIDRADGSAYVEWGLNKAIAAVYGPREMLPKHMADANRATIRFTYRMAPFSVSERKNPKPGRRDIEISKVCGEALSSAV